jgi:hypothetical protein
MEPMTDSISTAGFFGREKDNSQIIVLLREEASNYLLRCSRVTSVAKVFLFKTNSGPFFSEYQIVFLKTVKQVQRLGKIYFYYKVKMTTM